MMNLGTSSPILLVAAAQVLVMRPPLRVHGKAKTNTNMDEAAPDGMRFVQHVGYWSHYNSRFRASAWPFRGPLTLAELLLVCDEWGILREHGEIGDLVVRGGFDATRPTIGIVMNVEQRSLLPRAGLAKCDIAWEVPHWGERPRAELRNEWVRIPAGDRYVAWHDAPRRRSAIARAA
jgi:hypothetical protein